MPDIIFPSKWLKAGVNVKQGDIITFVNVGEQDKNQQWIFTVRVESTGEEKLFSLNKKNFNAISALYGKNSDSWVGKRMKIRVTTVENPKTGEEVEAVRLVDPARDLTKGQEEIDEEPSETNANDIPF